jgi:hypothetical protein
MSREELLLLLKEHLTISVNTERGSYGGSDSVTVSLSFDGVPITESSATINLGDY